MIETHHLSKVYSRGLYALRDLTLTIEKAEFVFLTGPSGAGKSTFLRLLLLQEKPSEGEVFVNGQNLATLNRSEIQEYRRGIGFIFQDFKLIPSRTVLENISFVPEVLGVPAAQQRRRAFQVLKWVGLQHRMNAYPQDRGAAVVHLFRFENDRIIELWDVGQALSPESPNQYGMF